MQKYILKRIGFGILTLCLMVIVVFFLQTVIPNDPIPFNSKDPVGWRNNMKSFGLLDPTIVQFFRYLGKLFSGTWGIMYGTQQSVWSVMTDPIIYSIILTVPAALISIFVGIPLGIVAANYRGRWPDVLINVLAVTFMAIPSFALVIYFTQWFKGAFAIQFRPAEIVGTWGMLKSYAIPVVCLSLGGIAPFVYYTRNEMVEVLKEDYIQTAQSKGLKWRTVLWKHAIRNGMIPVITIIIGTIFVLISGSFIIEGMFNIPGVANQFIYATTNREINQIMFITIFFGALNFVGNLITDISYAFVDPRISYGTTSKPSLYRQALAFNSRRKEKRALANKDQVANLNN